MKGGTMTFSATIGLFKRFICITLSVTLLSGATALSAGTMRNMTSMEIVEEMTVGWNLGNTLDATGGSGLNTETSWSNPKTTKRMMDQVKAKGFKTVRIPVTWNKHFGGGPYYTIDPAWMDRVQEVVNYVIDNGMYAILNSHHDDWVVLKSGSKNEVQDKITKLWKQIANRFKDYSDYLIFETLNEPRLIGEGTEWTGGTHEARLILNSYNLAIVKTIRETGGNNARRHIMIPTHAATAIEAAQDDLEFPENDDRIIVSQHTYWPYPFTMEKPGDNQWGTEEDQAECDKELNRIYDKFCSRGIPVVVGEWGSINKYNDQARAFHAEYYTAAVRKRGMCPVWWDNGHAGDGGFALLNRSNGGWHFQGIVDGLIKGSKQEVVSISEQKQAFKIVPQQSLQNTATPLLLSVYDISGRVLFSRSTRVHSLNNELLRSVSRTYGSGSYIIRLENGSKSLQQGFSIAR